MLGKCLKHEWMETWLVGVLCCGSVLLVSILAFFILPQIPKLADSEVGRMTLPFIVFTLLLLGIVAFFGAVFIGTYYFFYRYYKNLFTDQGYLMHTLPVETKDLINSKLIVAVIWQYLLIISYVIAVLFATTGIYGMVEADYTSYIEFMKSMTEAFNMLLSVGKLEVVLVSAYVLLMPLAEVQYLYLAVNIGQLGKKNRFLLSICALIGIGCVRKFVMNIASFISAMLQVANFRDMNNDLDMLKNQYDVVIALMLLFQIVSIVGVYVLNMYIVKNKLNLE